MRNCCEWPQQNKLHDPQVLAQQTRRMLADPKASALTTNFAGQWLYLRELKSARPESREFNDNLRQSFRHETELLFDSIMREDRSVVDLLNADYTFVDERLAQHYGIPGVYGSRFRRVKLPDDTRRGLLGQGSILLVTSVATRTSPVARGKWVLENILGTSAAAASAECSRAAGRCQLRRRSCPCERRWRRIDRIPSARLATRSWTRSGSRSRTSI